MIPAIVLLFILLLFCQYLYIGLSLIKPLKIKKKYKFLGWSLLIGSALFSLFAFASLKFKYDSPSLSFFVWLAYLNFGFSNILATLILLHQLVFLFLKMGKCFFKRKNLKSLKELKKESSGKLISRKNFLFKSLNFSSIGISGLLTSYGIYNAECVPEVKRIIIPISKLPISFHDFKIIQITDLHITFTTGKEHLENIIKKINKLKPDLIAITGDLIDGPVNILFEKVKLLKKLRANQGIFFVTGNHEYYSGANEWVQAIRSLGITVLENNHQIIKKNNEKIILAGVTDYKAGRFNPEEKSDPFKAIKGVFSEQIKILLAHQPRSIYKASQAGYDLQISGHTHGGQYFPGMIFVYLQQPYLKGLYKHHDTWLYVSPGTAFWGPPLRIGSKAEITEIKLVKNDLNMKDFS